MKAITRPSSEHELIIGEQKSKETVEYCVTFLNITPRLVVKQDPINLLKIILKNDTRPTRVIVKGICGNHYNEYRP
jgi:hypothetical protein